MWKTCGLSTLFFTIYHSPAKSRINLKKEGKSKELKKKKWLLLFGSLPVFTLLIFLLALSNNMVRGVESAFIENTVTTPTPVTEEIDFKKEKQETAALTEKEDTFNSNEDTGTQPEDSGFSEPFTVAFAGDTMFDWGLRPVLDDKGYEFPFEYVSKDLQRADYTVVNLETAVTKESKKAEGQLYWINSDRKGLEAIKNSGVDMVNLGNNHVLDYGEKGLLDTIDAVNHYGLAYIGAGKNAEEAYRAEIVELNNQTVAFLSFSRFFPDSNWAVSANKPGVTNGYDLNFVISKIKEAQKQANADYLIVNFHWGIENTNSPDPYQREYVKRIVDETETDAIVGAHPHWLQGFEFYQDVPVAYSLGNFLFPDYVEGHSAETGVYHLTFDNGKVTAEFDPYVIQDNQIQPLKGEAEQAMYKYLDQISINADLDEEGRITESK